MSQESTRIYSTSEVASRLGVSGSLLRRYGLAWERVQGETLPHLPGLGRLYPQDVVESLEEAQAWLEIRPEASVEEALRAVLGVSAATRGENAEVARVVHESVSRALSPLLEEISRLGSEVRALHARLGASQELPQLDTAPEASAMGGQVEAASEGEAGEVVEAEIVEDEPTLSAPDDTPPAAAAWDFAADEAPPAPAAPKISVEARKGYRAEPWPAPWRVQPPEGEDAPSSADSPSDFDRLEDEFAAERERDDEQDKGFVNWFKRNF